MNLPKYPLASSKKLTTFEFISEGEKGLINKIVKYQPTNLKGIYNLAFGDKNGSTGSTKARTRLYRMGITRFLEEANTDFEILGEKNNDWEYFKKNIDYEGFLVRRKKK
jgi:hypothetical protein